MELNLSLAHDEENAQEKGWGSFIILEFSFNDTTTISKKKKTKPSNASSNYKPSRKSKDNPSLLIALKKILQLLCFY